MISALVALIGTGTGVFFAVKNWINLLKSNSKDQNWKLIMQNRQRSEEALVSMVVQAYTNGVSTRKIKHLADTVIDSRVERLARAKAVKG